MITVAVVLGLLGALCLAVGGLVESAHRAKRRDMWIRPAAQILIDNLPKSGQLADNGVVANVTEMLRDRPERFVKLPKVYPIDTRDLESCVTVRLPVSPGSQEKTKDKIVADIGSRLGFDGVPTAHWTYVSHGAVVKLYPTPSFGEPRSVYDYLPHIERESGNPHRVVLGLDLDGSAVVYDHVKNGPHVKTSVGSGGGKSNQYRFLVPQYIRSGAQVIILDVKGVSMLDLAVALEFRNIKYFSEAHTCHDAFQAVFEELERRRKADIEARLRGEKASFAPLHVIMEEANTLMAMLKDFWEYAKKAHAEAAVHSPAIRAMHYSVYMGREFGIYLHVIAQRAEANVFGGGAVRENFNAALMSKWDMRTWKMLAHGHKYIPHPMDWSWYLVTSSGVVRYLPPMLQESDAVLIADLDNVAELVWPASIEAVPDVRVTAIGGGSQRSIERASVDIELPVTMTLAEVGKFIEAHGYAVPYTTLRKWQSGERKAESQGFAKWPAPEGDNADGAKVYKRLDIVRWMVSKGEPKGTYWDGYFAEIKASDCCVRHHVIYGLYVQGIDGVAYVGQTHQEVETRVEQHREDQYWGDVIVNYVKLFEGEMTCIEARGFEAMLIDQWGPTLNRAVPQIGAKPVECWNPAGERSSVLRDARHERDREAGRELFTPARQRATT